MNLMQTTAAYNFIYTLSKFHPTLQDEVVKLLIQAAEAVGGSNVALSLSKSFESLLKVTKSTSGKLVSVGLVAVYLTIEAWNQLQLWWNGEITGKRCAKNIIDSFAGLAAGYGGGVAGAAAGSSIVNGIGVAMGTVVAPGAIAIGSVIGAVVGGVAFATAANHLSDWLTQKIFNLPKDAAVENAYIFLELKYGDGPSNDKINSSFRHLALKYHPDKGGSYDDCHKLQIAMAVIKLSKGEI
jgi:hypothetical protein